MKSQLSQQPLPELIREAVTTRLSGVLRLSHERAKAAIYFQDGELVFAASNLRAHRLCEILTRGGLNDALTSGLPTNAADDELAELLIQSGRVTAETLLAMRTMQVSDVLRVALLWIHGEWEFDSRVRLADDLRVSVDVNRLLLECARRLPAGFVASRFRETNGTTYRTAAKQDVTDLLPAEASVLCRAWAGVSLSELTGSGRASKEDDLRAIYALSLSGLLECSGWPALFGAEASKAPLQQSRASSVKTAVEPIDEAGDPQALFARLKGAKNHYQVLDIPRLADAVEIKRAYHSLARRFHPDHFHKSDPALRGRVDTAFARIAQAYETLSDSSRRIAYDAKLKANSPAGAATKTATPNTTAEAATKRAETTPNAERAEASFKQGLAALKQDQREHAIRLLADAAMLAPREARYRAHYGHALIGEVNARRVAESELQAAVSLEPNNASHRVMLAELYKTVGLRRRAQTEVERALATDPRNEAARALLASLKSMR